MEAASPAAGIAWGGGPCVAVCGDRPRRGSTRCVQADVRSISIGGRGKRDQVVTTAERERGREEREREREEEKRERERIAGARAAAAGPAGKWEEGPGLQDPRRPRPRPLHQRRLNAPGTSQGKREPQAGHPTRAASSPDRQWPPLGPGALADAGSPNRDTPTFGAWRSRRDKLSTGLSPWWEL